MNGTHSLERPDADRPVGATGNKCVSTHLKLANKRCVALQDRKAFTKSRALVCDLSHGSEAQRYLPRCWVPDTNIGVKTAGNNSLAVKGNGVNLTKMALECL